jgi:hypothetical protein
MRPYRCTVMVNCMTSSTHTHMSCATAADRAPERSNFGALRVVNDDLVKGKAGFGVSLNDEAQ